MPLLPLPCAHSIKSLQCAFPWKPHCFLYFSHQNGQCKARFSTVLQQFAPHGVGFFFFFLNKSLYQLLSLSSQILWIQWGWEPSHIKAYMKKDEKSFMACLHLVGPGESLPKSHPEPTFQPFPSIKKSSNSLIPPGTNLSAVSHFTQMKYC